jgi:hypothetical protein
MKCEFLAGSPFDFANERVLLLPIRKLRMIAKSLRQLEFAARTCLDIAEANFIFQK